MNCRSSLFLLLLVAVPLSSAAELQAGTNHVKKMQEQVILLAEAQNSALKLGDLEQINIIGEGVAQITAAVDNLAGLLEASRRLDAVSRGEVYRPVDPDEPITDTNQPAAIASVFTPAESVDENLVTQEQMQAKLEEIAAQLTATAQGTYNPILDDKIRFTQIFGAKENYRLGLEINGVVYEDAALGDVVQGWKIVGASFKSVSLQHESSKNIRVVSRSTGAPNAEDRTDTLAQSPAGLGG